MQPLHWTIVAFQPSPSANVLQYLSVLNTKGLLYLYRLIQLDGIYLMVHLHECNAFGKDNHVGFKCFHHTGFYPFKKKKTFIEQKWR